MAKFSGPRGLESIHLRGTGTGDNDLALLEEELGNLPNLYALDLGDTQITDSGLRHLSHLHQVRVIHLDGTLVTPHRVEELRRSLPKCEISAATL